MAVILPAIEKDLENDGVAPPPASPTQPKKSHQHLMVLQMVAGAFSGAVTKTATAPLERIKIIFQVQGMAKQDLVKPKYTSILQTLALVSKEEGVHALWKGNGANVLRVIPVYGLKFAWVMREGRPVALLRAGPALKASILPHSRATCRRLPLTPWVQVQRHVQVARGRAGQEAPRHLPTTRRGHTCRWVRRVASRPAKELEWRKRPPPPLTTNSLRPLPDHHHVPA